MHCPVCNSTETKVTDSRVTNDGISIKRRRECDKCSYRFSTREDVEIFDLTVVKRDGRREPYSKDKLTAGLLHSLHKLPFTQDAFSRLVQNIERDIHKKKNREITSQEIGEIIIRRLRTFNKVAYIRFASVYRSFQDVSGFEKEIKELMGKKKSKKRKNISK